MAVSLSALDTANNERGAPAVFQRALQNIFFLQNSSLLLNTIASGGTMKMFFPLRRWPRSHSHSKVAAHHWERQTEEPRNFCFYCRWSFSDFLKRTDALCKKWSTHFLALNMYFVGTERLHLKKRKKNKSCDWLVDWTNFCGSAPFWTCPL